MWGSIICVFTMYNIVSNLASSIHIEGRAGVVALSIVYGLYIIFSVLSPIILAFAKGQAPIVCFICSHGYGVFALSNIYGRIYTLCVGAVFVVVWAKFNHIQIIDLHL